MAVPNTVKSRGPSTISKDEFHTIAINSINQVQRGPQTLNLPEEAAYTLMQHITCAHA